MCLCAYLCAVSISVFKSVFFCHINIWFGWGCRQNKRTVSTILFQPKPNQISTKPNWKKNTLFNKLLERTHKWTHRQTCVLLYTCVFERAHICLCAYLCAFSKSVFFCQIWFGWYLVWLRLELNCWNCPFVLSAASTKPNVNLAKEHTFEHTYRKSTQINTQTNVCTFIHTFAFVC